MLRSLAGAVTGAIGSGSAAERTKLVSALKDMEKNMPAAVSEDAGEAKAFLSALISLLEGRPVSAEGLAEPYSSIYTNIINEVLAPATGGAHGGPDDEMRNFLTQLAATVVMVMKKGTDEEKKALAEKLVEVKNGIPQDKKGAGDFLLALVSLLDGHPVDANTLPAPYANFYRRVSGSIASDSR